MSRGRGILPRLALVALSLLVSLCLAEAALRVYFWRRGVGREDVREVLARSQQASRKFHGGGGLFGLIEPSDLPGVVYQVKPHLVGTWRDQPLRTNRFGMRGREIGQRKGPRTF